MGSAMAQALPSNRQARGRIGLIQVPPPSISAVCPSEYLHLYFRQHAPLTEAQFADNAIA